MITKKVVGAATAALFAVVASMLLLSAGPVTTVTTAEASINGMAVAETTIDAGGVAEITVDADVGDTDKSDIRLITTGGSFVDMINCQKGIVVEQCRMDDNPPERA